LYPQKDRKSLVLVTDLHIGLNRLSLQTFLTATRRNIVISK
jgi:hypothetical protein